MSRIETSAPVAIRPALCFAAALLVAYVGVVHEVVGSVLYPQGPSELGGPIAWHALGLAGIVVGLLLAAGVLRLLPIPVRPLAIVVALLGAIILATEAVRHGGFHFFAFSIAAAGGFLAISERVPLATGRGGEPRRASMREGDFIAP